MISQYSIAYHATPAGLSEIVTRFLDEGLGWEIYNQPFVGQLDGKIVFCQTMTKSGAYKHDIVEMIG